MGPSIPVGYTRSNATVAGALAPPRKEFRMAVKDREPSVLADSGKPEKAAPADSIYQDGVLETMAEARGR